jgi:hypothetical protein
MDNGSDDLESEAEIPTTTGKRGTLTPVQLSNPTIPVSVSHSRLGYP